MGVDESGRDDKVIEGPRVKIPRLRLVGGVLLAMYAPPILAIIIARRWKDVPRWMRVSTLVFSFLFPVMVPLMVLTEGQPIQHLCESGTFMTYYLSYVSFSVCYMRHCKIRASLFLKCAAGFLSFMVLLSIAASVFLWMRQR